MLILHLKGDFCDHCMISPQIPDGLYSLQTGVILHHVTKCHTGLRTSPLLLNIVIMLLVSENVGNLMSSYTTMRISGKTLLYGINFILIVVINSPEASISVHQNLQIIKYLMLISWHISRLVSFLHTVKPQVQSGL